MTPLREYIELDISIDIREKTRVSDVFMDQCQDMHTCIYVYLCSRGSYIQCLAQRDTNSNILQNIAGIYLHEEMNVL